MKLSKKKLLTIIIPTFNSAGHLALNLKYLSKQTNQNFCVLVVDDRSSDETKKIALQHSGKFDLTFIEKSEADKKGAAASINLAFSKIKTKYWALIDSDALLKPNWVSVIIDLLEQNKLQNVMGSPIYASKKGGLVAFLIGLEIESRYQDLTDNILRHLSTCNIAGNRNIIKYINLDENLQYAYDHELSFQLNKHQIYFTLTKKTGCEHINKSGFLKYFIQQFKIAMYHTQLSKNMPAQAIKGDKISPIYLLLQPITLSLSFIFLPINYLVSIILIIIMLLFNWNFLYFSLKKNLLYFFPVILLIFLKNFGWIFGAIYGLLRIKA